MGKEIFPISMESLRKTLNLTIYHEADGSRMAESGYAGRSVEAGLWGMRRLDAFGLQS